ncbi:MAG: dTDP-4-dehydrorhamnose reductase [Pyrinomonadaceae bacterium]
MKILITGAGGLVGSHMARALGSEHQVLALKHNDLDITDAPAVKRLARDEQPSLIINCAVVGVDECEHDPALARAVNIKGTRLLAEVSAEIESEFLHFSSNYVFDGNRSDGIPYTTDDESRPINVYGRTKLAGERSACAASARTYIIRTSWVYGPGKASFLSTAHERLMRGLPVRAITDTWASTTYVADLVERTREILARRRYGVYQIVNEGTCSYHDFAVEAAGLAGLLATQAERLIELVTEADLERTARRPRWTPMRCLLSAELSLSPMRDWRSALADYARDDL